MSNSTTDTVKVIQLKWGDTEVSDIRLGETGYCLRRGENIAAFYLDAWTRSGRAYVSTTCNNVYLDDPSKIEEYGLESSIINRVGDIGMVLQYPSFVFYESSEKEQKFGEVFFPEFEGWSVFSVTGGKTLTVCLVRD